MNHKLKRVLALLLMLTLFSRFGLEFSVLAESIPENAQEAVTSASATWQVTNESNLKEALSKAAAGDIIEICADITLSQNISIGKNITICSAAGGSYAIYQAASGIRHFTVNANSRLTLQNITLNGNDIGGGIQISSNGSAVMDSGAVVRNCSGTTNGGGIRVASGGSLTINNGAEIKNCSTTASGGGVYTNGVVSINGGAISNNRGLYGGGIYAADGSVVNIHGGEISKNESSAFGGGIFMSSYATVNMYGGKISENSSVEIGGGITVSNTASLFTMYGGEITQNTSAKGGGIAMYNVGALFVMKGGKISNNKATGTPGEGLGGGLYLNTGAEAQIYAGTFTGNMTVDSAGGHGGAIYTASKTHLTIYNANITDNSASFQGGGIWVCNTGSAYVNEFRGMALYGNRVNTAKSGKDMHLNTALTAATLSNVALGNGAIHWRNEVTGSKLDALENLNGPANLTTEISQSDLEKALQYATVFITDNTSAYRGGGLAINGSVAFGETIPEDLDLEVSKSWNADSQENRPDSVKVFLVIDGVKQNDKYVILNSGNGWKNAFKDLPYKDANENVITYSVEEEVPANYLAEYSDIKVNIDGNYEIFITNTYDPANTVLTVEKAWDDENNKYGKRPDSVTVQLYADDVAYGEAIVLNSSNGWTYTWNNLPKYRGGDTEIVYTVKETKVGDETVSGGMAAGYIGDYATDDTTGIVTITNIFVPEKTAFTVEKAWDDENNRYNKRPASVTVQLYADNVAYGEAIILNASNSWTYTWGNLLKYSSGDTEIVYTVKETKVGDEAVSGGMAAGYIGGYATDDTTDVVTITNTYAPEKTALTVEKAWSDQRNRYNSRPDSVTVQLYADGVIYGEAIVLSSSNDWTYTWDDLLKYSNGNTEIVYTVRETRIGRETVSDGAAAGYSGRYSTDSTTGIVTITNTYALEETGFTVEKAWDDENNRYNSRPDSVTVQLYANGIPYSEAIVLNASNNWTYTWGNLLKYSAGNTEIIYTVKEIKIGDQAVSGGTAAGYIVSYTTGSTGVVTITNTYAPEKTVFTVEKAWEDGNNKYNKRPAGVTVQLYADNVAYGEAIVLNSSNGWTYSWGNLAKYSSGNTEVIYTVKEIKIGDETVSGGAAAGYTGSYSTDEITGIVTVTNRLISTGLTFRKVDADHTEKWLPGAKFTLYVCNNTAENHVHSQSVTNAPDCCWTEIDTQISNNDGLVTFNGLIDGEYLLVEAKAPENYQRSAGQWLIKIDSEGIQSITTVGQAPAMLTIKDDQGNIIEYLLPNSKFSPPFTGEADTLLLALSGLALSGAIICLLVTFKKKKEAKTEI